MVGSLKMIKDPGTDLIGRMRKRIGLFTLLAVLSILLLPHIGIETAFSATPPVAADLSLTAEEDTGVTIYLSGADQDGDALSFRITALPTNGGVLTDGCATYSQSSFAHLLKRLFPGCNANWTLRVRARFMK